VPARMQRAACCQAGGRAWPLQRAG
jgi:hypothetical protein